MRIETCGGIAAGKTTLASALKACFPNSHTVLENAFSGDFLSDFYLDSKYYAYETEVFFLLQHMHQLKVGQRENMPLVCEFSLEQDSFYGENNLEKKKLFFTGCIR